MPELSMIEARKEILSDFKLEKKDLVLVDYDELMEKAEAIEHKKISSVLEQLNSHKMSISDNKKSSVLDSLEER